MKVYEGLVEEFVFDILLNIGNLGGCKLGDEDGVWGEFSKEMIIGFRNFWWFLNLFF